MAFQRMAVLAITLVGCAVDVGEPVAETTEAIVDGRRDFGTDSVVYLVNLRGSACTASIVAPRVVLTAKHCIQADRRRSAAGAPSQFRVYVGDHTRALTAELLVSEIRPAPGCWNLCGDASDVAVLILSERTTIAPLPMSFDSPTSLAAQRITAIGYGQTPSGEAGVRLTTQKRVTMVGRGLIFTEPSVCSGDSGGPLIGPDGAIYGVASFTFSPDGRTRPTCGTAPGAHNQIAMYRELIETAIEDSGTCIPDGEEVCNDNDDDCDGLVDETCTAIGGACTASDECVGTNCASTEIGMVCTRECNPRTPAVGCSPGFFCANAGGCDGHCIPIAEGGGMVGLNEDCSVNSDCVTFYCADPGDRRKRCLSPCEGDTGACLAGEACAALPGACGGCIPAGLLGELRGIGEPCELGEECRSTTCFDDAGVSYCSRACTEDPDCPEGFHCRETTCARGPRGAVGSGCVLNEDCAEGNVCARRGDVSWCTTSCGTMSDCPDGFDCVAAGGLTVCAPIGGLVGEQCEVHEDCISGLCIDNPAGRTCTRLCGSDNPCEAGLECIRTADGIRAVCVPPPRAPVEAGGDGGCCSVAPGADPAERWPGAAFVLIVLGMLAARRRR